MDKNVDIKFALDVVMHALSLSIAGKTTAEILKKEKLDPEGVKNFIITSDECREYLKQWGFDNLLRIRESVSGYLETMFPHYKVTSFELEWKNGSDALKLS